MKKLVLGSASIIAQIIFINTAQAQVGVEGTLPNVKFSDSNGVDFRSGQILKSSYTLSIGLIDAPTLSNRMLETFRDADVIGPPINVRIQKIFCQNGNSPATGCFQEITVEIGTVNHNFGWQDGFPKESRNGSKLEETSTGYILTDQDGTKYIFDNLTMGSYVFGRPVQVARVKNIIRQNGEQLSYAYGGWTASGVRSITSNTGYQLRFDGTGTQNSTKLINLAVDYCDPVAANCSTTRNWPSINVGSGGVTDQSGRIYSASVSNGITSVTSPGGGFNYSYKRSSFGQTVIGSPTPTNVIATEWYQDSDGRTTYAYTVDRFARITESSATRPDGSVQRFKIERDNPYYNGQPNPGPYRFALTDPLGRITRVDVKKYQPINDTYWPLEFDISLIRYPEGNVVSINRESIRNRLIGVSGTPKPGNNGTLSSTASFTNCSDWSLCARPDYTIDARGNRTDYTYDPTTGLMITKTLPADSNGVRSRTRYAYRQIQAVYKNSSGQLVASGSPVWKVDFTSTCRTATECTGTVNETRVTFGYDGNLLPTTETTSAGDGSLSATVTRAYDAVGNVVSVDGPLPGSGDTGYYFYDDARQLIGEIGPDPDGAGPLPRQAVRNTYDLDGLLTIKAMGSAGGASLADLQNMTVREQTTSIYSNGRKVGERRSAGGAILAATDLKYDTNGRLICTAIRMNQTIFTNNVTDACSPNGLGPQGPDRITSNEYDVAGQLLVIRKAVQTSIAQEYARYTYTDNGKQKTVKDANNNLAGLEYDGYDRLLRWRFPSKVSANTISSDDFEQYDYDENGNRKSLRRRDGRTLIFGYDALNRMTSKIIPDGCAQLQVGSCPSTGSTRDVYYGYDLAGHQLFARFDNTGGEGITSTYDAFGRLATSTTALGGYSRTLGYQYDLAANRTRITHPDGVYFSTVYDDTSRMRTASWWSPAAGTVPFLTITYDAFGRRSDINRGSSYTGYGYDGLSRLSTQSQRFAGNVGNVNATFGYNPSSQIVSRSRDNSDFVFTGYANRDLVYAVNGLNQYSTVTSTVATNSYQYDANGNLISDGGISYSYDAENRLISSSNSVGLTYDPLGRLWQTTGSAGTTQFLYDGDALVAEYNGSGGLLRRYMHGPGVDEPILVDEGSALNCSGTRFLNTDHQGSVIALANCSGIRQAINAYDDYGVPNSNNTGRFQYTGQALLPELGMYHYKARIYSPRLGRFLQTDPIGYDDQINLYAYVGNDPINGRDPTGMQTDFWGRVTDVVIGTGEVIVGGIGAATGITIAAGGVATEVASAGVTTPVSVPAVIGGVVLTASSTALAADGSRRIAGAILPNRKNDIPSTGTPGSEVYNPVGTKGYRYGPNGQKEQEWNAGHPGHPAPGDQPHVHDHEPRAGAPAGVPPRRGEARAPQPGDMTGPPEPPVTRRKP